jgi:hypothetical protein
MTRIFKGARTGKTRLHDDTTRLRDHTSTQDQRRYNPHRPRSAADAHSRHAGHEVILELPKMDEWTPRGVRSVKPHGAASDAPRLAVRLAAAAQLLRYFG